MMKWKRRLCALLCAGLICFGAAGGAEEGGEAAVQNAEDEEAFKLAEALVKRFEIYAENYDASEEEWKTWETIVADSQIEKWAEYEAIPLPNAWFDCHWLPGNVYVISEPLHEQLACAFLIPGEERALLLDTCTGLQNIREVTELLTDLPVTVLNSHDHFDHIGGNAPFDEVWCYNDPGAVSHLKLGPTGKEMEEIQNREKSVRVLSDFFGVELLDRIPGKAPTGTVEDGQVIDLGGRKLEVLHTPGHQRSCIMLADRENGLLFTGDMFYPGLMYCMFDDSSFPDYVRSIRKAANLAREIGAEKVYTSHNLPEASLTDLERFADYLEGIENGEITEFETEDGYRIYQMDEVYSFEMVGEGAEPMTGFSVPAEGTETQDE